ncbi:NH(3)-dependent NAD(+) synthetase [Methanimicrococcus sp. At1]|uniref:NH(3)-dependent NAD(+) synthetase n=1 Tax=Methanimicrococcus hacksteinii TaxID=3028293 RepID=A0ABU3VMY1_9EURY|nr:NAD+ synthase [Methanimicrococcus sp. At1]MDV0444758.1 NH(3)-dependent NAD(+) synthetase [Methanimicrococcus sp. At1]
MTAISFSVPVPFQNFDSAAAEQKIIAFIRNIAGDAGCRGVVLGLSGGIDSALVAALSVKALGAKNVHPIFFYNAADDSPCNSDDLKDASILSEQLGLTLQTINLYPTANAAESSFSFPVLFSESGSSALSLGNLKSRLRMSLLYYYANTGNLLVIGTKNKTERLTGYYTKYGDGGVDLDPIADLYKTEVRLLSKHMNLPESILSKTPSAGFWNGQSDEADLGLRYEQLDSLLYELEKTAETEGVDDVLKLNPDSEALKSAFEKIGLTEKQYKSVLLRMKSAAHKQKPPNYPIIS